MVAIVSMRASLDTNTEIDRILPHYQFVERHWTIADAPIERVFSIVENVDLSDSRIAKALQAIWRIPARFFLSKVPSRSMSVNDFIPLIRKSPRCLSRGLVSGAGQRTWSVADFSEYQGPGFKLAWSYTLTEQGMGRTRIDTETRVFCCDPKTKRWFTLYWAIIRPWSGLIRMDLLRIARKRAIA